MKRTLVTGVSGYIGPYLCIELLKQKDADVTGIYNSHSLNIEGINYIKCDLTNPDELTKIFRDTEPDVVYHLASVTPTRIAAHSDEYVEFFNNKITAHIAKLCRENNSLLVYTSTDLVYCEGENLKEEEAKLNPLTIYAKTKLMAENSVKEFAAKYIILRTALVYGFTLSTYTSFFDFAYKTFRNGNSLNAFCDQFRKPIYTEDAAKILNRIPEAYIQNNTLNLCGDEYLSRYDMCMQMAEVFGFEKKLIKKGYSKEFTDYPMVKRLGLNNEKMKKMGLVTDSFKNNLHKSMKYIP